MHEACYNTKHWIPIAIFVLLLIITIIMIFFAVVVGQGIAYVAKATKDVQDFANVFLPPAEEWKDLGEKLKAQAPAVKQLISDSINTLEQQVPMWSQQAQRLLSQAKNGGGNNMAPPGYTPQTTTSSYMSAKQY